MPGLILTYSPSYRTPLPLYGSGLRIARTSAANSPTCCLSQPWTRTWVWSGQMTVSPGGIFFSTSLAKPTRSEERIFLDRGEVADADDFQLLLVALGDTDDHVLQQGAGQPVERPGRALVVRDFHHDLSFGFVQPDAGPRGGRRCCSLPLGPVDCPPCCPSMATLTPSGMAMGFLPIRDMAAYFLC